jgi:hypothetical protein
MQLATIGLDLAKNVFQLHGVDAKGRVVVRRRLRRAEVMRFFAELPPCRVGWRRVPEHTTGRGRSASSATRSG